MRFAVNFYRLLAPRLLIFQLAALATSLGFFLLFGPPEAQTSTLPITPLPSLEEVTVSAGSAPPGAASASGGASVSDPETLCAQFQVT